MMGRPDDPESEQLHHPTAPIEVETEQIYEAYQRHLPNTPEAILRLLQRYNLPWYDDGFSDTPPRLNKFPLPAIKDTVPSSLAFSKYLPGVFCIPFFYRMNFLSQLSTVGMTTHLDGRHTRLSHAIGATKVAAALLESIERNKDDTTSSDGPFFTPFQRKACLFYCFIHDVFHGPFGHTLDMMKDVFHSAPKHKKLDDFYLDQALRSATSEDPSPEGRQLLAAAKMCTTTDEGAMRLLRLVHTLTLDKERIAKKDNRFVVLKEIVDSELDADRLDYIQRDSHSLRDSRSSTSLARLVEGAKAVPDGTGCFRLAYRRQEKEYIEELLRDRQRLYAEFYEAVEKLIVDDMICHAMYYILRERRLLHPHGGQGSDAERMRQRILTNILILTDSDLVAFLRELRADQQAYSLLLMVRQHQYYSPVYQRAFRVDEANLLKKYGAEFFQEVGEKLSDLGYFDDRKETNWRDDQAKVVAVGNRVLRRYREELERRYRQEQEDTGLERRDIDLSDADISPEDVLIYLFQWFLSGSFHNQFELEKALTKRLLDENDADRWMEQYGAREHGRADWYEKAGGVQKFERFPPIHVTTTSFFGHFGKEQVAGVTKEGGRLLQKIWLYNDTGDAEQQRIRPATRDTDDAYPFIVSVAPRFEEAVGRENIQEALFEELRTLDWYRRAVEMGLVTHDGQ